jgi:serine phosphatase RsbU (regulator of sigma subunit)
MTNCEIDSRAFHEAELRSERTRVHVLLRVFAGLLGLVLIRGTVSLAEGRRSVVWPFAVLLAMIALYEVMWLRFVNRSIDSNRTVSRNAWTFNSLIESLVPTAALFLEIHSSFVSPDSALSSPVVLTWLLFIILSALHLNPGLSRLTGVFSVVGYLTVSIYVFVTFPGKSPGDSLLRYSTAFSFSALLLLGGFATGAVANQIRVHVLAALHEAESRARIAQLEQSLDIARSIQQGLLPKAPPRVRGFDIAGWNQPADETGGDYFDWQQLADGRAAITVADVSGHGIGPALCMASCRAYARACLAVGADLQGFMLRMNQVLDGDLPLAKFVTMVVGVLDPAEETLHLISAGHGPLFFYSSKEDKVCILDAQGPPLGLLPQCNYGAPEILKILPGDILVLITDGFIEWENAQGEEFGAERLMEVVRACRDMPSAGIISEMYSAVIGFAGPTPQRDDLTGLVVKRSSIQEVVQ